MAKPITELILEWQALGDDECFTALVHAAMPVITRTATRWLTRRGVCTAARVDDVASCVLDHLRRLHPRFEHEQAVAPFRPEPDGSDEAGLRYVAWLTRRRTQDLLRTERRRLRRQPTLTEAGIQGGMMAASARRTRDDADGWVVEPRQLRRALEALAGAERQVVGGLLEGHSQNEIAALLGVSAGTVSRRKHQAFARLRHELGAATRPPAPPVASGSSAAPQIATPASPLPCVTIQYQTRSAGRTIFVRHLRSCALGCLVRGELGLTWIRQGRRSTSQQRAETCNFFLPEDVDDEFIWEPRRETVFHTVLIPPECFAEVSVAEEVGGLQGLKPMFGFQDPVVAGVIRAMRRRRHDGDVLAQECLARSLVLRILELQGCGRPGWQADDGVFTAHESRTLVDYVDAHLHGRIVLAPWARVSGLSPGHFNRKFRRTFGVTPSRFVTFRRIQRVVELLRTTDMPVEDIATSAGFCSPSHVSTMFRSIVGVPPSRFRAEAPGRLASAAATRQGDTQNKKKGGGTLLTQAIDGP